MSSFCSKRKVGRQKEKLYKVPTVPFYEKTVRQRTDEQKGNWRGYHPGNSLKQSNGFTQHIKDWAFAVLLNGVNDLSFKDQWQIKSMLGSKLELTQSENF